jgi:hypothetical protein
MFTPHSLILKTLHPIMEYSNFFLLYTIFYHSTMLLIDKLLRMLSEQFKRQHTIAVPPAP